MSWQAAVAAGRHGDSYGAILAATWPAGRLTVPDLITSADCRPLPQAQAWLASRARRWRERLLAQAGYQPPAPGWRVCELVGGGPPWSDQRRGQIHVRDWTSREGRVALIHEYLHLALAGHPSGQDEATIEQLAQALADS
jgi:uncharacterized protein YfaQ (DUF2300 family)